MISMILYFRIVQAVVAASLRPTSFVLPAMGAGRNMIHCGKPRVKGKHWVVPLVKLFVR